MEEIHEVKRAHKVGEVASSQLGRNDACFSTVKNLPSCQAQFDETQSSRDFCRFRLSETKIFLCKLLRKGIFKLGGGGGDGCTTSQGRCTAIKRGCTDNKKGCGWIRSLIYGIKHHHPSSYEHNDSFVLPTYFIRKIYFYRQTF